MTTVKRPRTGERRQVKQPLKIDRLPLEIHERILALRNRLGKTWEEIEAISAEPYDEKKHSGLVDWDALPAATKKLFPGKRLPHSSLHRWYDLRVSQVRRDVEERSAIARELAASFAKSVVAGGNEAVTNAARDQLMALLAEDLTPKGRLNATKGLIGLAEILQSARANDIKERKVGIDARRLAAVERELEMKRAKFEKETNAAAEKTRRGQKLTEADINSIRSSVFGLGPAVKAKK